METTHISIIPGGCPQFLDFTIDTSSLPIVQRFFKEEKNTNTVVHDAHHEAQRYTHTLRCLEKDEDDFFIDQLTKQPCDEDYSMDIRHVLDIWDNTWIPLPFLRTRGQTWDDGAERYECGPSNWVRARMTKGEGTIRHLTLIFDTNVEPAPESGERYYALSPNDVSAHGTFSLAHHVRDNGWFLNEAWIDTWLLQIYDTYRTSQHRGRGSWRDENTYVLEHLASYLTWLEMVRLMVQNLIVQVINPEREQPVEVDLVLDIGNSRTTGILVETLPQRITNLNDSYLLELRDITQPQHIYSEPFETRIEFTEANFGDDLLSRRSGRRTPAFAWPSAVRVGPEAARLATRAVCAEGSTGMSSPKRYLWDERPWQQSWRYNTGLPQEPMVIRGLFAKQVNCEGTPLSCFDDPYFKRSKILRKQEKELAFASHFTRSSLMLFMVGEIITQALVTINAPATRSRRDLPNVPRRLRRILFTVPTAMPEAEKRIFRRWVNWAVRVIWESLGWSKWYLTPKERSRQISTDYRINPQVRCDWDEASCSQIVYIYNELSVKQHGDAHHLFHLLGKPRAAYDNKPCMRIASIDTGGGTMDLSIATYELASPAGDTARICPHMEFRDGFNIAGDEVLRDMVSQHIIPALKQGFTQAGATEVNELITKLFGRDTIGISKEQRNLRARFVRQVAVPLALGILSICEVLYQQGPEGTAHHPSFVCKLKDFFHIPQQSSQDLQDEQNSGAEEEHVLPFATLGNIRLPQNFYHPMPQSHIIKAVEDAVCNKLPAEASFSLLDMDMRINPAAVENTIRTTLGPALADLCEMVHLYDCDLLLLTGRPSAWNGIVGPVLAKLPVPADRIMPMRRYRVGNWYPFADAKGCINDPKTTVVVGAILCALAEGHLEGFSFDVGNLALTSTARYVGELNTDGKLPMAKVWFEVDIDSKKRFKGERQVSFTGPLPIGYRQVHAERWPTTRYHLMAFTSEEARAKASGRLPYDVLVRLEVAALKEEEMAKDTNEDRDEGEFEILSIVDKHGSAVNIRDVEIRLQTLQLDEGYWLDTGMIITS